MPRSSEYSPPEDVLRCEGLYELFEHLGASAAGVTGVATESVRTLSLLTHASGFFAL